MVPSRRQNQGDWTDRLWFLSTLLSIYYMSGVGCSSKKLHQTFYVFPSGSHIATRGPQMRPVILRR